jgi:hypothetical protein
VKKYTYLIFFSFFLFFVKCQNSISENDIQYLKRKYSPEAINYFYETVFFSESMGKRTESIDKWKVNPKIVILGFPNENQIEIVNDVVNDINNLNLSINYSITKDIKQANIKIYFDQDDKLQSIFSQKYVKNNIGTSKVTATNGCIVEAEVYISDIKKRYRPTSEKAVLTEEISQTLGLNADSYSYTNSVFYQGEHWNEKLSKIDKDVLNLLYENSILKNYSRNNFERDFGDVLYSINASEKLKKYILINNISRDVLNKIHATCFIKNTFYKHPKSINVYLNGDYDILDSIQVVKTIRTLNKINNINIKLSNFKKFSSDAGIFLNFKKNNVQNLQSNSTTTTHIGNGTMFLNRYRDDVEIIYSENSKSKNRKKDLIVETLYRCLGPDADNLKDLYIEKNGEIYFKEVYSDILRIIYDNVFINGYTINEFNNVIKEF